MGFFAYKKSKKSIFSFKFPAKQALSWIAKIYAFWQSQFTV